MKIRKEYFILAAIILALSLYLFLRESDRALYELPKLPAVPQDNISKIEITKQDGVITLNRRNDSWNIGPQEYPADNARVKDMLRIIENLTLTAMVSESKDYTRYQLDDEHKITVRASIGEKLSRDFDIGKVAPSYRHTFVKLKENELVYHARQNFRHTFDVNVDDIRDKQVLAFDKTEIQEIRLLKNGRSLLCARSTTSVNADKETVAKTRPSQGQMLIWESAEGQRCDEKKLNRLLDTLSNLRCERYIDNKKKEDLTDPIYSIELKGTQEYKLSIFAKAEGDAKSYPATSSENKYPFLLPEEKVQSIMKAHEEMLEETEKKDKQGRKS